MWIATIVGKVDDNLAAIERGPPCVSRWITLWSRVLRVYVATANQVTNFRGSLTGGEVLCANVVPDQETFVHDR